MLYEFFARYIGQAIIENRDGDISKAKALLRKHFNTGTDLYKELKLFEALYDTRVASTEAAASLINKVRAAVRYQSPQRLELEKSSLIHEVNTVLNDSEFFNRDMRDYKTRATIQILLNSWRSQDLQESSLGEIAELEDNLLQHLTHGASALDQKNSPRRDLENVTDMTTEDVDRLVVNLMTEKVNARFNTTLNEDQKSFVRLYVFSRDDRASRDNLLESLTNLRTRAIGLIERAQKDSPDTHTTAKLQNVKDILTASTPNSANLSDDMVTFYLGISKLEKELTGNETA